jgi:hypothetical protein
MLSENTQNQLSSQFLEPEEDIQGVEKTIIFPRLNALKSGDCIQRNLGYLIFALSEKYSPERISIQTAEGKINIHVTENFVLGAVLTHHADTLLVDEVLNRAAVSLEEYLRRVKPVDIELIEEKIKERGDGTPG